MTKSKQIKSKWKMNNAEICTKGFQFRSRGMHNFFYKGKIKPKRKMIGHMPPQRWGITEPKVIRYSQEKNERKKDIILCGYKYEWNKCIERKYCINVNEEKNKLV